METQTKQITEIKKELEKQSNIDEIQEEQIEDLRNELIKQKEKTRFALKVSLKAISEIEKETRKQVTTSIIAAFGFLIALVWKDVITNYTNHIVTFLKFPSPESFQIVYTAVITTFLAVVGIVVIGKSNPKKEEILKQSADQQNLNIS